MANVTITIPDQHVDRVVHTLCAYGGYETENAANAKQVLINFIKTVVRSIEYQESFVEPEQPDVEGIAE